MAKQQKPPKPPKTVAQMRAIIESGNSVSYGDEIITRVQDLPTEVQAARTPEERATAVRNLQKQRDDLDAQIAAAGAGADGLTANEHGIGPDTDGGPNPDFAGDDHADDETADGRDAGHKPAGGRKRHK